MIKASTREPDVGKPFHRHDLWPLFSPTSLPEVKKPRKTWHHWRSKSEINIFTLLPKHKKKTIFFPRSDSRLIYGSIKTCTNGKSIDFSFPNRQAHENRLLIPTQVCAPSRWVVPIKIFSRRVFHDHHALALYCDCNAEPVRRKILTWAKHGGWVEEQRHCRDHARRAINKQ